MNRWLLRLGVAGALCFAAPPAAWSLLHARNPPERQTDGQTDGQTAMNRELPAKAPIDGEFRASGMRLTWRFAEDRIHCALEAPTRGWIALGFAPQAGLNGTVFVMGARDAGGIRVEERLVVQPGMHRSLRELGRMESVEDARIIETRDGSRLEFSLPHTDPNGLRPTLKPGALAHLMLAYSLSPDFAHHSRERVHRTLGLESANGRRAKARMNHRSSGSSD